MGRAEVAASAHATNDNNGAATASGASSAAERISRRRSSGGAGGKRLQDVQQRSQQHHQQQEQQPQEEEGSPKMVITQLRDVESVVAGGSSRANGHAVAVGSSLDNGGLGVEGVQHSHDRNGRYGMKGAYILLA